MPSPALHARDRGGPPLLQHDAAVLDFPHPLPRRGTFRAGLALLRPRQWLKNGLVFSAAGAAGALGSPGEPARVGLTFVAFCLLASSIYAVNDVRDVEEDRQHPRKCRRPVAAGELSPRRALMLSAALAGAGLGLMATIRPLLALVGVAYLALTLSYTYLWRSILLLDLLAIGGGFLLRAVAGGVAARVDMSEWFLLVISLVALLVAAGKREAERRRTAASGGARRAVLARYSRARLRTILTIAGSGALLAYCGWALKLPSVGGVPWRLLTIAPFAFCLLRYLRLVRLGRAEAPDELVLEDRPLLVVALLWALLFIAGVDAAG